MFGFPSVYADAIRRRTTKRRTGSRLTLGVLSYIGLHGFAESYQVVGESGVFRGVNHAMQCQR